MALRIRKTLCYLQCIYMYMVHNINYAKPCVCLRMLTKHHITGDNPNTPNSLSKTIQNVVSCESFLEIHFFQQFLDTAFSYSLSRVRVLNTQLSQFHHIANILIYLRHNDYLCFICNNMHIINVYILLHCMRTQAHSHSRTRHSYRVEH